MRILRLKCDDANVLRQMREVARSLACELRGHPRNAGRERARPHHLNPVEDGGLLSGGIRSLRHKIDHEIPPLHLDILELLDHGPIPAACFLKHVEVSQDDLPGERHVEHALACARVGRLSEVKPHGVDASPLPLLRQLKHGPGETLAAGREDPRLVCAVDLDGLVGVFEVAATRQDVIAKIDSDRGSEAPARATGEPKPERAPGVPPVARRGQVDRGVLDRRRRAGATEYAPCPIRLSRLERDGAPERIETSAARARLRGNNESVGWNDVYPAPRLQPPEMARSVVAQEVVVAGRAGAEKERCWTGRDHAASSTAHHLPRDLFAGQRMDARLLFARVDVVCPGFRIDRVADHHGTPVVSAWPRPEQRAVGRGKRGDAPVRQLALHKARIVMAVVIGAAEQQHVVAIDRGHDSAAAVREVHGPLPAFPPCGGVERGHEPHVSALGPRLLVPQRLVALLLGHRSVGHEDAAAADGDCNVRDLLPSVCPPQASSVDVECEHRIAGAAGPCAAEELSAHRRDVPPSAGLVVLRARNRVRLPRPARGRVEPQALVAHDHE